MNVHAERRESRVWRILSMPVGPSALLRRRGAEEVIGTAALPTGIRRAVECIVRRTRLWHGERVEVAAELCAHFADGLAAGGTETSLLESFGDPRAAAALIRRAKKRGRPLAWRAWIMAWRCVGVGVGAAAVAYAILAVRYFSGSPVISHNYLPDVAGPGGAVPESQRAWPLYREAAQRLEPDGDRAAQVWSWGQWGTIMPGDANWAQVEGYLDRSTEALELVRRAAARPRLGREVTFFESPDSRPLCTNIRADHLGTLRGLARTLAEDTALRASRGDGQGVVRDVLAILGIAAHAREAPVAMNGMVSLAVFNASAVTMSGRILEMYPAALGNAELVELAHHVGTFAGGGTLRAPMEAERLLFMDMVQRVYTDDGHGDGRMTPRGLELLRQFSERPWEEYVGVYRRLHDLMNPVSAAADMSRKEAVEAFNGAMLAALEVSNNPIGTWRADPSALALEALGPKGRDDPFLSVMVPAYGMHATQAEAATQRRDAVLVAIALELYRRERGTYPSSLGELTPRLLPTVPIDRFDGKKIKYMVRDGWALLYSVGPDHANDGGVVRPGPNGNRDAVRWYSSAQIRIMRSAPGRFAAAGAGSDWILWPPIDYDQDGNIIERERRPAPAKASGSPSSAR